MKVLSIFCFLILLLSFPAKSQFSLSVGGGGSIGGNSSGSTIVSTQPKLKVSEKTRAGLDIVLGLGRSHAFLLDADFKKSSEKKFYWGMGTGVVTNSSSNFLLAPRVGFRGNFDFSASLFLNPNRRAGSYFLLRIMYVIGSKD